MRQKTFVCTKSHVMSSDPEDSVHMNPTPWAAGLQQVSAWDSTCKDAFLINGSSQIYIYRSHKYEKILEFLIQVMQMVLRMFNYSLLLSCLCHRNKSWFYEFLTHSAALWYTGTGPFIRCPSTNKLNFWYLFVPASNPPFEDIPGDSDTSPD
jgi:hypothetical protein